MDLADRCLYHAFFSDALALFHYLHNHKKRNTKLEMDRCIHFNADGYRNASMFFHHDFSENFWAGLKDHLLRKRTFPDYCGRVLFLECLLRISEDQGKALDEILFSYMIKYIAGQNYYSTEFLRRKREK